MPADAIRLIVITVPPEPVCDEIDTFRRRISEVGRTYEALTYPPHITMRTGALVPPDRFTEYTERFHAHLEGARSFAVATDRLELTPYESGGASRYFLGYGIASSEPLAALNQRLLGFRDWIKSNRTDFHPHLTIAFHDLDESGAERIRRWMDSNPTGIPAGYTWTCDNVGLYSRGEEGWEPVLVVRF